MFSASNIRLREDRAFGKWNPNALNTLQLYRMFLPAKQFFEKKRALALALLVAATVSQAAEVGDVLEFRGYIRMGGETQFSIYNKQEQRSQWVRVNEAQSGYTVESFDSDTNSLIVRYNGGIGTLSLMASQIDRFIPPLPETKPELTSPEELTKALTASISRANPPADPPAIPNPPSVTNASQRNNNSNANTSRLASTGRRPAPTVPPLPDPVGDPSDDDDQNDDDQDDGEWQSTGTPPPMPPTLPPDYSPED